MLLKDKLAVVHGGGGAIGGAVARAFAREGARVFLAGRTLARLQAVADDIRAAGGTAELAPLDVLDADAVARHADTVAAQAGGIDIALNAVGVVHVQGVPLDRLAVGDFSYPISVYSRINFNTAKAVAPHMARRGGGAILMLSTPASRLPGPGYLGFAVACAGIEALSRHLAGELGAFGIRVNCIRPHATPQTVDRGSHAEAVFAQDAGRQGLSVAQLLEGAATQTLLKRLPTLDEVAQTAVFLASR
ncbi:MAG TPA: SDR family oxidoreductase, partial [Burkholderiaceae bacterium]|nr:SDR family oxidoreductase [Burkholderiaceae bacterium]